MNHLSIERKRLLLDLLVEGGGLRGISRATGHHRNTIVDLMHETADGCNKMMAQLFVDLHLPDLQVDELWSYVHTKADHLKKEDRNGEKGDQYIFYALDRRSKLVPGFTIGKRTADTATEFMHTLKQRVSGRIQLTTDAYHGFNPAVRATFGHDVNYAQVSKTFKQGADGGRGGYAPRIITDMKTAVIEGLPNLKLATTSHVERANLTVRQGLRRFNRLTLGFSKKLECLKSAVAVFLWSYNFRKQHLTLEGNTPAMSAGIVSVRLDWETVL